MAADGGDCEAVLEQFVQAGVDVDALATRLQDEGAKSFVKSYPTVTPEQTGDGVITIIGCRCR